jgi:hypothetical protein
MFWKSINILIFIKTYYPNNINTAKEYSYDINKMLILGRLSQTRLHCQINKASRLYFRVFDKPHVQKTEKIITVNIYLP